MNTHVAWYIALSLSVLRFRTNRKLDLISEGRNSLMSIICMCEKMLNKHQYIPQYEDDLNPETRELSHDHSKIL